MSIPPPATCASTNDQQPRSRVGWKCMEGPPASQPAPPVAGFRVHPPQVFEFSRHHDDSSTGFRNIIRSILKTGCRCQKFLIVCSPSRPIAPPRLPTTDTHENGYGTQAQSQSTAPPPHFPGSLPFFPKSVHPTGPRTFDLGLELRGFAAVASNLGILLRSRRFVSDLGRLPSRISLSRGRSKIHASRVKSTGRRLLFAAWIPSSFPADVIWVHSTHLGRCSSFHPIRRRCCRLRSLVSPGESPVGVLVR